MFNDTPSQNKIGYLASVRGHGLVWVWSCVVVRGHGLDGRGLAWSWWSCMVGVMVVVVMCGCDGRGHVWSWWLYMVVVVMVVVVMRGYGRGHGRGRA